MKLNTLLENVNPYDTPEEIKAEIKKIKKSIEGMKVRRQEWRDAAKTPQAAENVSKSHDDNIRRAEERIEKYVALLDQLEHNPPSATKVAIYRAFKKRVAKGNSWFTLDRGRQGGIVLSVTDRYIDDSIEEQLGGWSGKIKDGTYNVTLPPEQVYVFPKGKFLWAYAPQTNVQKKLGPIDDVEAAVKNFAYDEMGEYETTVDVGDDDY